MTPPESTLRAWFAAHETGNLPVAKSLLASGAVVRVPGEELHGFDDFMAWYARRRSLFPEFRYEVLDILGGERHAAAVIHLHDGNTTWRQIAVYEVADGLISSVALYEDGPEV